MLDAVNVQCWGQGWALRYDDEAKSKEPGDEWTPQVVLYECVCSHLCQTTFIGRELAEKLSPDPGLTLAQTRFNCFNLKLLHKNILHNAWLHSLTPDCILTHLGV